MKATIVLLLLIVISCQTTQEFKGITNELKQTTQEKKDSTNESRINQIKKIINNTDSLFILNEKINKRYIRIIPPRNYDFEFPDDSTKTELAQNNDFNADGKEDKLVYLGACGTGGCMFGLFLNQYDNYYKLAFMDYLKNAEFEAGEEGFLTIISSEEIVPYVTDSLQMYIYKFDKKRYEYYLDTTYVEYQ